MASLNIEDMVEVKLLVDFKIVKETLARMGIANKKQKILYPSCYLYQNFEKFYIVHFKELFLLSRPDGYMNICSEDIARKNSIIFCLIQWGLIEVDGVELDSKGKIISVPDKLKPHDKFVFVLKNTEKFDWQILHKFNINSLMVAE